MCGRWYNKKFGSAATALSRLKKGGERKNLKLYKNRSKNS